MTSMHHLRKKHQFCSNSSKVSSKKHHVSSLHQLDLEGSDLHLLTNGKELNDKRAAEEERKQLVPRRKRPKKKHMDGS